MLSHANGKRRLSGQRLMFVVVFLVVFSFVGRGLLLAAKPGCHQGLRTAWSQICQRGNKPRAHGLAKIKVACNSLANDGHADGDRDFPQELLAKKAPPAQLDLARVIHRPPRKGANQRRHSSAKQAVLRFQKTLLGHC